MKHSFAVIVFFYDTNKKVLKIEILELIK